jgi:hypothetical protein
MQPKQARMNRRDQAELIELITTWNKRKRGMIPRGHKLIITLDVAPITPCPIVEVRVAGKSNSAKAPRTAPTKKRAKKLKGDTKTIAAMPLAKLGLSPWVYKKLINSERLKIKTIGNLFGVIDDLDKIPLSARSAKVCRDKLAAAGLVD